jgi:hypothetical protein
VAAIAVAACAALTVPLLDDLSDLPRADIAVRNDTEWDLGLVVRTDDDSVMPIATIGAGRSGVVGEVPVPTGDRWRLAWRFRGDTIGESTVAHDDLAADGFVLEVPDEVARALREGGAPPSP